MTFTDPDMVAKFQTDDTELRNNAALHLLSNRLQYLKLTNPDYVLDSGFVTCAEYQLFLDYERQKKRVYRQPDHWVTYNYTKDQSLTPIAGIRGEDALAFCDWLNSQFTNLEDDDVHYRLPRIEEVRGQTSSQPNVAAWCFDDYTFNAVGLSNESVINFCSQLSLFLKVDLLPVTPLTFSQDRINLLNRYLDLSFPPTSGTTYAEQFNRAGLNGIRSVLQPILDLHYGYRPIGRDMFVATDYDAAHIGEIVRFYQMACDRTLTRSLPAQKYSEHMYTRFRLAGFEEVTKAIENKDLTLAFELIKGLSNSKDIYEARWSYILKDYLQLLQVEDGVQFRRACRHYLAHIALFAFMGYSVSVTLASSSNTILRALQKTQRFKEAMVDYNQLLLYKQLGGDKLQLRILSDLYWQMVTLIARETGHLAAWEGIRLVRERK